MHRCTVYCSSGGMATNAKKMGQPVTLRQLKHALHVMNIANSRSIKFIFHQTEPIQVKNAHSQPDDSAHRTKKWNTKEKEEKKIAVYRLQI